MAKVVYSSTHRGSTAIPLEDVFAAQVTFPPTEVTDTSATVGNGTGGNIDFLFEYVLTDGTTDAAKVHSFTLALSPDSFVNAEPFITYDADPNGDGSVNVGQLGSLHGNAQNRMALLFAGDDTIIDQGSMGRHHNGYAGNDTITASSTDHGAVQGNYKDTIDGGTGADLMRGGFGEDNYFVDNAGDKVSEAERNVRDFVHVSGNVTWTLQAGSRVEDIDVIGTGKTNINGNAIAQTMTGNDEANTINGKGGADAMAGKDGNDVYWVDNLGDTVTETVEDDGVDTIWTSVNFSIDQEFLRGYGTAAITLTGGLGNNKIFGNDAANKIFGGQNGTDVLDGRDGNDTISGAGLGLNTIFGGAGNDKCEGADLSFGTDKIDGGTGNDELHGFDGTDKLDGGAGNDKLFGGTRVNIHDLADTMDGGAGNDTMDGGRGDDIMTGGLDDDTMRGAQDNDTLTAGDGNDALDGGAGADVLNGGLGNDTMKGAQDNDTLTAGDGNDALDGGAGADVLNGGLGNDTMSGAQDNDKLIADAGNDAMDGGAGKDALTGGLGKDIMTGGADNDRFDFNAVAEIGLNATRDVITDFEHLADDINLSTIDANGPAPGDGTFTFLAAKGANFTAIGQVRWFQDPVKNITLIEGNVTGDHKPEFQIELTGLITLVAADFIL